VWRNLAYLNVHPTRKKMVASFGKRGEAGKKGSKRSEGSGGKKTRKGKRRDERGKLERLKEKW